ncbi:hypothetical protein [Secundilactobacillus kimchicus]|uniref:hypothetical protein n=1 Tax=Secundilactobacillus kimchicus TaxID=528209 RepID=UPI0024A9F9C9|nr:hypothetical protein [Secundilactobacillus kimchicus]
MAQAKTQTTVEAIMNYPVVEGVSKDSILQSIVDTWHKVVKDGLPDEVSELGHRYLVLSDLINHALATSGGVIRSSTKDYSEEITDWSGGKDPYMAKYEQLLDEFGLEKKWQISVF